jgi:NAD-dependent deacetylase
MTPTDVQFVARAIAAARRVVVSTGAGMSAESGVATFRDPETGLWTRFNPAELATPQAFARDPLAVWAWYRERRRQLTEVRPHAGHFILADWQERLDLTVITQNVDGLHSRAGSRRVVELHGRLDVARCPSCGEEKRGLIDLGPDPRCELCGARLRPGVVWFGESLPQAALGAAFECARACEVMLIIGTSSVVEPAASLADAAREAGATLVEINPHETERSHLMHVSLRSPCGPALQALDETWRGL